MPRLIAFGDSYTYGHGLEDCHIPPGDPGPKPSLFAWPQLLGDKLDLEVINKGVPGNSNIQILRDIITSDFHNSDVVVVGWTFPQRDFIFKKNILGMDTSFQISPWFKDKSFVKKWLTVHNDHDLSIRAGLYIHHAECFLKTKKIKQYHFCAHNGHKGWIQPTPTFTVEPENFIYKTIMPRISDTALDGSHPGPKVHRGAATRLYEIINEK